MSKARKLIQEMELDWYTQGQRRLANEIRTLAERRGLTPNEIDEDCQTWDDIADLDLSVLDFTLKMMRAEDIPADAREPRDVPDAEDIHDRPDSFRHQ